MVLLALAVIAAAYQLLGILACVFCGRAKAPAKPLGPVSVLKPVRGMDPGFREAIRSHTVLQGDYEFLCGVSQPNDPALPILREFSRVRVVASNTRAANAKVGVLIDLAAAASYPVLVVNDADIRVPPDYLARVTAPLADARVGLVTCLYRPVGDSFAARFEGLGVATDFAPSALVARLLGVDEFAMGSTLAFRREDLERIGGFAAVADYLADDYQVGHRIHALGLKCVLSDVVVETHLGGGWRQVWAASGALGADHTRVALRWLSRSSGDQRHAVGPAGDVMGTLGYRHRRCWRFGWRWLSPPDGAYCAAGTYCIYGG